MSSTMGTLLVFALVLCFIFDFGSIITRPSSGSTTRSPALDLCYVALFALLGTANLFLDGTNFWAFAFLGVAVVFLFIYLGKCQKLRRQGKEQ